MSPVVIRGVVLDTSTGIRWGEEGVELLGCGVRHSVASLLLERLNRQHQAVQPQFKI